VKRSSKTGVAALALMLVIAMAVPGAAEDAYMSGSKNCVNYLAGVKSVSYGLTYVDPQPGTNRLYDLSAPLKTRYTLGGAYSIGWSVTVFDPGVLSTATTGWCSTIQ